MKKIFKKIQKTPSLLNEDTFMKLSKLEDAIKDIARVYFVSLRYIHSKKLSSGESDYYSPFYKYYADVEEAFASLDKENQRIITNEYFYDAYKGWWTYEYKESIFKKLKKAAIKQFVEKFYAIH